MLFLIGLCTYATHNRAGEITYRQLSGLTFEVTIITYTATGAGVADRPELEIMWGDNTKSILPRIEAIILPDNYKRNKYIGIHTFPGPGLYKIVVEDPNRNYGVSNIPNSVNTVFSISTTMYINSVVGTNNTPILTRAPLDKAAIGRVFIHNPGAYDPDGDSISYKLTECRADNGEPILGYTYPAASNSFSLNEVTGDLVWDTPVTAGVYNVAMMIEEWRGGIKIGQIIRDMQIEVFQSDNLPPVVNADDNICVEAGTTLNYIVSATDPNSDIIKLSATGAPFLLPESSAVFTTTISNPGYVEGLFTWYTNCNHVRKQGYNLNIKAKDEGNDVSLVDIKNINITVVGPAVENVVIDATSTSVLLNWDVNRCSNVIGYNIYRKISPSGFIPESCQIGVPDGLGFTKIVFVEGRNIANYEDFEVSQGHIYCYLICAVFPDNVEGYASAEVCTSIIRGIPTITNVSVVSTSENSGEVYVAWAKPTNVDIGEAPGPYQYILYRSEGFFGENLVEIYRTDNVDDTTFNDTGLNTKKNAYSYKVEFYNNSAGNRFLIGAPHIASSVFLKLEQMENALKIYFEKNVPWINTEYTVFRQNEATLVYDSIGVVNNQDIYYDRGLINGREYCYYLRSKGSYTISGIINPIINLSQRDCNIAIDTTAPCAPVLLAESFCDAGYNSLSWNYKEDCNNDVKNYFVYYKPFLDGNFQKIYTLNSNVFSYKHFPEIGMAGCYYVTAIDSFSNESLKSNIICLDNCTYYSLPNVFSPNGDDINDYFQPIKPYYYVTEVDMKILNRWGQLMFETKDPEINWDGTNYKNGQPVSDGVYFYECDVYEQRLTGIEVRHLQGFIHVFNAVKFQKRLTE